jgi:hypothetical protein
LSLGLTAATVEQYRFGCVLLQRAKNLIPFSFSLIGRQLDEQRAELFIRHFSIGGCGLMMIVSPLSRSRTSPLDHSLHLL